jgi:hypothetical protein
MYWGEVRNFIYLFYISTSSGSKIISEFLLGKNSHPWVQENTYYGLETQIICHTDAWKWCVNHCHHRKDDDQKCRILQTFHNVQSQEGPAVLRSMIFKDLNSHTVTLKATKKMVTPEIPKILWHHIHIMRFVFHTSLITIIISHHHQPSACCLLLPAAKNTHKYGNILT